MKKVRILCDSNAGITIKEAEELGITIIPTPIIINGEEFFEGVNITSKEFFDQINGGANVSTSQPSEYSFDETCEKLLKDYDELVYIPITTGLSAACPNSIKFAEKFNGKVEVVDNRRVSVMQKESIMEAIALAKKGKSAKDIKETLEKDKDMSVCYIYVDTLKYLKKGGRISGAAATIANVLHVKPILYSDAGAKFEKMGMIMSLAQAKKKMIDKVKSDLQGKYKDAYDKGIICISVAHTENLEQANKFKEQILKEIPNINFRFVDPLSLSVSAHIGPGSLAIALTINNTLK